MSGNKNGEMERAFERLDALWKRPLLELPLAGRRYAVISDIHLGDGNQADDFHHNEEILTGALGEYHRQGYTMVLLGDVEELWQFEMLDIRPRYDSSIYESIRKFGQERVLRIFGNHDIDWGSPPDPVIPGPPASRGAPEGLKLTDYEGRARILLVHGHQGTADSDLRIWLSRFAVRGPWRLWEPLLRRLGLYRNPSEPRSRVMKDFERIRYEWARSRGIILICGHTHRAIFASESRAELLRREIAQLKTGSKTESGNSDYATLRQEIKAKKALLHDERRKGRDIEPMGVSPKPCYFNTGCCLYASCITAIEIEIDDIRLVKWRKQTDGTARREVLRTGKIVDMINQL